VIIFSLLVALFVGMGGGGAWGAAFAGVLVYCVLLVLRAFIRLMREPS
jgi:hypothetical protein